MMIRYHPTPSDWAAGHWEKGISLRGSPYWIWSPAVPKINEKLLRCVFYIYPSEDDALQGNVDSATGFFFGVPSKIEKDKAHYYAVTNKHVIKHSEMENPVLRINTKDNSFNAISTKRDQWKFHPLGSDLAICFLGIEDENLDVACFTPEFLLTEEFVEEMSIGAGDDVFMIGNFKLRGGKKRNYPTVRFGNIAQMPNEPMINPHTNLDEESFIVEMRSISGYSGSPVVLSISNLYPRYDEIEKVKAGKKDILSKRDYDHIRLLGINWGHIRTKERLYDEEDNALPRQDSVWINSAMAGVVPSWKISEMIFSEKEIEMRKKIEEQIKKERNQSEIQVDFEREEENEFTKEDMENALKKAFKPDKKKTPDEGKKET